LKKETQHYKYTYREIDRVHPRSWCAGF